MIQKLVQHPEGLPNIPREACPEALQSLTLERNSVLIARISRDSGYDMSTLQELRKTLANIFPTHQVLVWYDDVNFMAIHDKGYMPERLEGLNDSSNYY